MCEYRAASALQEAAAEHKKRTGRPFVLIIDAVDRLAEHAPDILKALQVLSPVFPSLIGTNIA